MGHAALEISIGRNEPLFQENLKVSVEHSFLTGAIQAAGAYLKLAGTEAQLSAALAETERTINSFLDRAHSLDYPTPRELAEVLSDCLSLIADFREGPVNPEHVALFLADAEHFHSELLVLCAASAAYKLRKLEETRTVESQLLSQTTENELTRGLYQTVTAALEKEDSKETLCQCLESHYDQVVEQLSTFKACLGPTDWTSQVRPGDQLALRGLTLWLEGLELLQEFALFGREALKASGLQRLLEGNRSFLSAQKLLRF